jgi:nitrogen regulatory protein PII-like uncharacterized protein
MKIKLSKGLSGYYLVISGAVHADQWLGFATENEAKAFLFGLQFAGQKYDLTANVPEEEVPEFLEEVPEFLVDKS